MTKKEMEKSLKELYKLFDKKTTSFADRVKINREIVYLEMQLERMKND